MRESTVAARTLGVEGRWRQQEGGQEGRRGRGWEGEEGRQEGKGPEQTDKGRRKQSPRQRTRQKLREQQQLARDKEKGEQERKENKSGQRNHGEWGWERWWGDLEMWLEEAKEFWCGAQCATDMGLLQSGPECRGCNRGGGGGGGCGCKHRPSCSTSWQGNVVVTVQQPGSATSDRLGGCGAAGRRSGGVGRKG